MELNNKLTQNLNPDNIFGSLKDAIDNLYETFRYIGISREDYYKLVLNIIKLSKLSYDKNVKYIDFLKNEIILELSKIIENSLNNPFKAFKLVNNYINQKFLEPIDANKAIINLRKLDNFFKEHKFIPTPELIMKLIKRNAIFAQMTELIFNKYYTQIATGDLVRVFDSNANYCDVSDLELSNEYREYLEEISKIPLLNSMEERTLLERKERGDKTARSKLIESNLQLVVSIAKRYTFKGVDIMDLIEEGNIGLVTAIDKYSINSGNNFSTWLVYQIRSTIIHSFGLAKNAKKIPKYIRNQISLESGIPDYEPKNSRALQDNTISLDELLENSTSEDLEVFGEPTDNTLEAVIINALKEDLNEAILESGLNKKEIEILYLRFGFDGNKPWSYNQISKKYNISRQRVQQIIKHIIKKIRLHEKTRGLAIYTECEKDSINRLNEFNLEYKRKSYHGKHSLYSFFPGYKKEEVDIAISKLNPEEKELLFKRFGDDLEHPGLEDLPLNTIYIVYGTIIPKIRKFLENPNYAPQKRRKRKPSKKNAKKANTSPINNIENEEPSTSDGTVTDEDVQKAVKLLENPIFNKTVSSMSTMDAVIVSLKSGYVDGKCFSAESIAVYFGIETEKVRDIIMMSLMLYRDGLIELYDKDKVLSLEQKNKN